MSKIKNHNQSASLKRILVVAIPTMVITLSRTLMGFVDFAFVAELSKEAVAAITPAGITMWVIIGFGMGTASIVSTFAAQSFGKGQTGESFSYAWQMVYLSLCFALVSLPFAPYVGEVMGLFGHEPAVLALEKQYASVIMLSVGPSMLAYGLQCFFIGVQKARIAMVAALIANAFNALANYTLIFGHFGFEAMGIKGAALGTVFSTIVQAFILLFFLLRYAKKEQGYVWIGAKVSLVRIRQICRFGIPSGAQWVVDILAWTFFTNILIGRFGTDHLAASNIALQLMHLSFMPAVGLGQALSALVGKSIGERNFTLAKAQTMMATRICFFWMLGFGFVYWFFGGLLIGVLNDSESVREIGADIMKLAALFQVFDAVAICAASTLKGAGDTSWTAKVSFACNWVIFAGGGALMAYAFPELGARGPWSMASAFIITIGVVYWLRFKSDSWESIDVFANGKKEATRKPWRAVRVWKIWRRGRLSPVRRTVYSKSS